MGFGMRMRGLWPLRGALLPCVLFALTTAVLSVVKISLPPDVELRALKIGTASTQVVVDTPKSALLDLGQATYSMDTMTSRAVLLGSVMASPTIRESIAQRTGVPAAVLRVEPPLTPKQPRAVAESGNQKHTSDILKLNDQYRLQVQADPTVPLLHIYAQAPDAKTAERLVNGAVDATQAYLADRARTADTPQSEQLRLVQLGRAKGEVINPGIDWQVAVLAFVLTIVLSFATVTLIVRFVRGWRLAALAEA